MRLKTKEEIAVAYILGKEDSIVVNIQALMAALLAKVWQKTKDEWLMDFARKQINFVLKRKTSYHAWYYTFPANKSLIKHDNYHTGGILDALLEYAEITDDKEVEDVYWQGLEYYRENLFEADGAPRWINDKKYPFDVHGAAQGIITFTKAAKHRPGYKKMVYLIADWTIKNLYRQKKKDFIYRRSRFFKYNFSLMHWCNGWMTRALAELIKNNNKYGK